MKLICVNADTELVKELATLATIGVYVDSDSLKLMEKFESSIDAIFIDWTPTSKKSPENVKKLLNQTEIIEKFTAKKTPTVIFDRYLGISPKEYNWLRKFNVYFCEPALNYRPEFTYLPFWSILKRLDGISLNISDRKHGLAYRGNITDKTRYFEKYFLEYSMAYPEDNVCFWGNVDKDKEKGYLDNGLHKKDFSYNCVKATVVIGSAKDYKIGYIDAYMVKALADNCIPLIPIEHRYYASFPWITVSGISDINYCVSKYDLIYMGLINDIYKTIELRYPEMLVSYTAETIIELLK